MSNLPGFISNETTYTSSISSRTINRSINEVRVIPAVRECWLECRNVPYPCVSNPDGTIGWCTQEICERRCVEVPPHWV